MEESTFRAAAVVAAQVRQARTRLRVKTKDQTAETECLCGGRSAVKLPVNMAAAVVVVAGQGRPSGSEVLVVVETAGNQQELLQTLLLAPRTPAAAAVVGEAVLGMGRQVLAGQES